MYDVEETAQPCGQDNDSQDPNGNAGDGPCRPGRLGISNSFDEHWFSNHWETAVW